MIQSPYQQNIDLLKEFFKKPIILILSILAFLSIVFGLISSITSPLGDIITNASKSYLYSLGESAEASARQVSMPIFSIDIIGIMFAVAFLLFYIFSNKPEGNLSAPSMILKVISIISVVFMSIVLAILITVTLIFTMIIPIAFNSSVNEQKLITILLIIFAVATVFVVMSLIYYISQLLFANSIRKGITSIYLKRKGAIFYGILNFIFALTALASDVAILYVCFTLSEGTPISPIALTFTIIQTVVMVSFRIVTGITAVKYSSYIKNVSQKFRIEINNQQNTEPSLGFDTDTAAFNNTVQPAPVITNTASNNPYEQVPNYVPQTEVPQAPVIEDFSQQPTVAEEVTPYNPEPSQQAHIEETPVEEASVEEAPVIEYIRNRPAEQDKEPPAPRYCIECGNPINPGDNFCNNCGKEINYE